MCCRSCGTSKPNECALCRAAPPGPECALSSAATPRRRPSGGPAAVWGVSAWGSRLCVVRLRFAAPAMSAVLTALGSAEVQFAESMSEWPRCDRDCIAWDACTSAVSEDDRLGPARPVSDGPAVPLDLHS